MSVVAQYILQTTVNETLETNVPAAGRKVVTHDQFNTAGTLNASSTPPATKVSASQPALVAAAKTIDLTALSGTNGVTVDGTGLKVQLLKIRNPAGNAAMTFVPGAANPYNVFGAAFKIILLAGQEICFTGNDATPDVAAGAKNIDVTGSGTQAFDLLVVLG